MAMSRYARAPLMNKGRHLGTTSTTRILRNAVTSGRLSTITYVAKPGERLDTIAAKTYGNGSLWWVIAGASGIGWWFQVPPGTHLTVPTNLGQVEGLFS